MEAPPKLPTPMYSTSNNEALGILTSPGFGSDVLPISTDDDERLEKPSTTTSTTTRKSITSLHNVAANAKLSVYLRKPEQIPPAKVAAKIADKHAPATTSAAVVLHSHKPSRKSLTSAITSARLRKKRAEADCQLLRNRIKLLAHEESRALKKVECTRERAQRILQLRQNHQKEREIFAGYGRKRRGSSASVNNSSALPTMPLRRCSDDIATSARPWSVQNGSRPVTGVVRTRPTSAFPASRRQSVSGFSGDACTVEPHDGNDVNVSAIGVQQVIRRELARAARKRTMERIAGQKRQSALQVKMERRTMRAQLEKQRKKEAKEATERRERIQAEIQQQRTRREEEQRKALEARKEEMSNKLKEEEKAHLNCEREAERLETLELKMMDRLRKSQELQRESYCMLEGALLANTDIKPTIPQASVKPESVSVVGNPPADLGNCTTNTQRASSTEVEAVTPLMVISRPSSGRRRKHSREGKMRRSRSTSRTRIKQSNNASTQQQQRQWRRRDRPPAAPESAISKSTGYKSKGGGGGTGVSQYKTDASGRPWDDVTFVIAGGGGGAATSPPFTSLSTNSLSRPPSQQQHEYIRMRPASARLVQLDDQNQSSHVDTAVVGLGGRRRHSVTSGHRVHNSKNDLHMYSVKVRKGQGRSKRPASALPRART